MHGSSPDLSGLESAKSKLWNRPSETGCWSADSGEIISAYRGKASSKIFHCRCEFRLDTKAGGEAPCANMTPLQNLSIKQLRKLIPIKEQIETLQGEIEAITGGGGFVASHKRRGRKKMSRSEAARIAVAARWAKVRAAKGGAAPKKKSKFSAAHRAALAAAQKARWARVRAEG